MTAKLTRTRRDQYGTFGNIEFDGKAICATLEPENYAIPEGTWELKLVYSNRFSDKYGHNMIWVCTEPGVAYEKAKKHDLIHIGNYAIPYIRNNKEVPPDTSGCILVGYKALTELIIKSGDTYKDVVYPTITAAMKHDAVYLEVKNQFEVAA